MHVAPTHTQTHPTSQMLLLLPGLAQAQYVSCTSTAGDFTFALNRSLWPCCASSHRMQPYTPTVLTGSGVTVLVASISVTLVTCGLGGVASGATAG